MKKSEWDEAVVIALGSNLKGPWGSTRDLLEAALARFLTGLPSRFDTATGDPRLHGVVVDVDPATGRALGIQPLSLAAADIEALASPLEAASPGA